MQISKKLLLSFILIVIMIFSFEKYSYGNVTCEGAFDKPIGDFLGQRIDQNGWWAEKNQGRNSCTQANSDSGYSSKIVSIYETLYNSSYGRIVANSVSSEGGQANISNADDASIRNFAASMTIDHNIQGVRDALMKCMKSAELLSKSPTLLSNNYDGSKYGGSSDAWESSNARLRENYMNYQNLQKVDNGKTVTTKIVTVDNVEYVRMGPYKMKFGTAGINGIYVNGTSLKGTSNIKYQINVNDELVTKTDFNELKSGSNTVYNLSNKNFYFLIKKDKLEEILGGNTTTVTIRFTQAEFSYSRGRTFICNNHTDVQGNAWYTWKSSSISGGDISFSATYNPEGKIIVEKVDKNDTTKKIKGVKIKVYGETENGNGWVKSDGTLVSDFSSASTYTTGDDGKATIQKLKKGTYYIYEISVPSGYNIEDQRSIYPNSKDPNNFAGKSEYGNCVYLQKVDSKYNTVEINGLNQAPEGKIIIEKVDRIDTNKKIKGVKIKVYGKTENGNGWVKSDGTLVSDFSSASTYTTGDDGKATIDRLRKGTYYIYEIEVPSGYYIDDQRSIYPDSNDPNKFAGKSEYNNCVYLQKVDSNYNVVEIDGLNQVPEGKIIVEKVNKDDVSKKIKGVKIKVYGKTENGNGWVKSDGTLVSDFSSASTYTTGDDGKATVGRLKKGTYYIYEIDVPSGYDIEDQRLVYPDSNDPNKFAGKEEYDDCVFLKQVDNDYNIVEITGLKQSPQIPRDLTITKKDKETNKAVANAGFKVLQKLSRNFKQGNTKFKKDTYVWIKSDGTISKNVTDAYEFTTGNDGKAVVKNILSYGTCYIYETKAGGDYELIEQEEGYLQGKPSDYTGTFLTGEWVYVGQKEITTSTGTSITITAINEHTMGSLTIVKKDATYRDDLGVSEELYLQGAKVKIYGTTKDKKTGWVKKITLSNGKIKYDVGSYSEAAEFTTDSNGKVKVDHLKYGTYHVYETAAPKDYNIKEQDGYHQKNEGSSDLGNSDWAYLGSTEVSYKLGKDITYEVGNYKYIEIKGKVWLDEPDTKGNTTDSIYNSSSKDKLVSGMTVNLYNRKTGKKLATTTTDSKGEYVFNEKIIGRKLTYWEAAYCYIEFIYDNTKYISVNPFQGGTSKISVNSKAQEEEITQSELNDNNLTGTTGANPGIAITLKGTDNSLTKSKLDNNASESLAKRLLTGYYNSSTYTIENINFGIIEKFVPDHTIGQELEYVKIKRGNYTFKYKYGDEAVTEQGDLQSTVKFQNSKKSFTQSIYPSDIKYNIANGLSGNNNDAFKIYVVYKIEVKNVTTESVPDIYDEQGLYLTSLTNSYDTSRYEISHDVLPGDDQNISRDFGKWSGGSGTASYDLNDSNKNFKNGLGKNQTECAYIEFKVTDSALKTLVTEQQLGESPTIVKSVGYHKYTRKDKNWKNETVYTHISINEERQNGSLYLKWKLFDTRTISGSVFEDLKDNSRPNERIGNGKYDTSSEKKLTDVVVSLINAEDTAYNGRKDEETYLYEDDLVQNPATGKWSRSKQIAVTKVDSDGNYSLKGVVPGKYYLKFTYGDGKTTIKDLNGNIISVATKIKGQSNTINTNYYKSTILTGAALNSNNTKWFIDGINEKIYSVATDSKITYYDKNGQAKANQSNIDIINARTTSDKEINQTSSQDKVVIDAVSPNMDIQFEYIENTEYQVTRNKLNDLKTNCEGMCFGIIERPHVEIELDKSIKNVKLTLSNGTNLINGNPEDKNVSEYLTSINKSYSKIETDYTNLYGSTVTIDYKLKAVNKSELDYATKDYYTKGIKGSSNPVTTSVTKIIDYVSYKECNYLEPGEGDKIKLSEEYINNEGYTKEDYYEDNIIEENKDYKDQLLITETQNLTPKAANIGNSEADYIVSISKLLPSTNTEENLGWESYSEILAITNITYTPQYTSHSGSYIAGDQNPYPTGTSEADNDYAIISITPPTGINRSYTIYIISAGILVILALGVLIIIKFVL